MPKLPSGLNVGTCVSPIIDVINAGDFSLKMKFIIAFRSIEDIRYVVSLIYYKKVQKNGLPIESYLPGLSLADVDQKKVGWSEEDYLAFNEWQKQDAFKSWFETSYKEIQAAVDNMKVKLPESLHGIMDDD